MHVVGFFFNIIWIFFTIEGRDPVLLQQKGKGKKVSKTTSDLDYRCNGPM